MYHLHKVIAVTPLQKKNQLYILHASNHSSSSSQRLFFYFSLFTSHLLPMTLSLLTHLKARGFTQRPRRGKIFHLACSWNHLRFLKYCPCLFIPNYFLLTVFVCSGIRDNRVLFSFLLSLAETCLSLLSIEYHRPVVTPHFQSHCLQAGLLNTIFGSILSCCDPETTYVQIQITKLCGDLKNPDSCWIGARKKNVFALGNKCPTECQSERQHWFLEHQQRVTNQNYAVFTEQYIVHQTLWK